MPISHFAVSFVCIGLPWLSPLAFGPSSAVAPWLVSLACVACFTFYTTTLALAGRLSRPLLYFVSLVGLVFLLLSLRLALSIEVAATVVAWCCIATMAWVGSRLASNTNCVMLLAKTWLLVALLSCIFAMLQYLSLAHWWAPWISASHDGVAYANLRQRNQFATLCGMGFVCIVYLRQAVPLPAYNTGSSRVVPMGWHGLALAILAVGNGLSSSRTGALQWVLIVAAVVCWRTSLRTDVRRLAYAALGMYALVVAALPWFAQWVGNGSAGLWGRAQEASVAGGGRMALYSNVLELIAQKPWFGWGWRELAYAHYSTHFDVRFVELLDNAHNLPLHLAVELGVPFALLFCAAIVWWVVRSVPWREANPMRQLAWAILMLLAVHSMVEYPLWYGSFMMALGLSLGLLQRFKFISNTQNNTVFTAQTAMKFVACALLACAAYLAFDYHRTSQIYLDEEKRSAGYRHDVLGAAQRSVVFSKHAQFAELVTTPVNAQTAARQLDLALKLVHYSPEPRVIEPLIESATMLHFDDIAMFHLARYKAVYPKDYAAWSAIKK